MLLVGDCSDFFHMVAKWVSITINYLARRTGHTLQQIIGQYETDFIADCEDLTRHKCHS